MIMISKNNRFNCGLRGPQRFLKTERNSLRKILVQNLLLASVLVVSNAQCSNKQRYKCQQRQHQLDASKKHKIGYENAMYAMTLNYLNRILKHAIDKKYYLRVTVTLN
jgi:intracellular septation protein A